MSNNDEVPHVSRSTYLSRQNFRTRILCVPHLPKRPQCTRKAPLAAIHWVRCVQSGPPDLDRTLPGRSCNCSSRHLQRPSTVSIDDISRIHRTHLNKIPQTLRVHLYTNQPRTEQVMQVWLARPPSAALTRERLYIHSGGSIVTKFLAV